MPVACSALDQGCPRENVCSTVDFWTGLDAVIDDYVDGVTLEQLAGDESDRKPYQTLAIYGGK